MGWCWTLAVAVSVLAGPEGPPPVSYLGFHSSADATAAVDSLKDAIEAAESEVDLNEHLVAEVSDVNFKLRIRGPNYSKIDDQISRVQNQIRAVQREKAAALDDIREGLFCSGCGKTKTEILKNERVFPHPGQTVIHMTPADLAARLAAKAAEFDNQINPLQQQIALLNRQKEQAKRDWETSVARTEAMLDRARRARDDAQEKLNRLRWDLIDAEAAAQLLPRMEKWARDAWDTMQRRRRDDERRTQERQVAEAKRLAEDSGRQETYWRQREKWLADLEAGARSRNDAAAVDAARQEREVAQRNLDSATRNRVDAVTSYNSAIREAQSGDSSPPSPYAGPSYDTKSRLAGLYDDASAGARRLTENGLDALRDLAKKKQSEAMGDNMLDLLMKQQDKWLEKQLDYGPQTLDSAISKYTRNAINNVLPNDNDGTPSGVVRTQIVDQLKNWIHDTMNDITRDLFVSTTKDAMFGPDQSLAVPTGNEELDRAQRDFELAVSPGSLFYDAAPFVGGRSIIGVKKYAERAQKKFFDWLGLATDKISEDASNP